MAESKRPIWYSGSCDSLLQKIKSWHTHYDLGQVYSTRDFIDPKGKKSAIVMKRAHTIGFIKQEIDNLKLMMDYYSTNVALTLEVSELCSEWEARGKLMGNGLKQITLAFFPEHVKEIYEILLKGKREHANGASIEEMIQKSKDSGKDLFEV